MSRQSGFYKKKSDSSPWIQREENRREGGDSRSRHKPGSDVWGDVTCQSKGIIYTEENRF